jgi:predicted NAD/FAD-binding protein
MSRKLDPTYRLYAVTVSTQCLAYASSAAAAIDLAKEQYLNDNPDWSADAKLSRIVSATPGHEPRYTTLGWNDDTTVYTDLTYNHPLTVAEAKALDRKTCELSLQQQGDTSTYIAECYLASGEKVERIVYADSLFAAANQAMRLPNVRNVSYVRSANSPQ